LKIVEAMDSDIPVVADLFREYQKWLGIDLCFQGFEQELVELPGCYAAPKGCIFLAQIKQQSVGCVAVRPRAESESELKRLYVRPEFQGQGIGKNLFLAAMNKAKEIGYDSIVLDTLPSMQVAQLLYRDFGFVKTQAYCHNPLSGVEYYRYEFK